jgi:hypothetical protein
VKEPLALARAGEMSYQQRGNIPVTGIPNTSAS